MRLWKNIEGPKGIEQILKIWRNNFQEEIGFQDLLQRIDEECRPGFSRRTKINYLNELVERKLLGKKKKGREMVYWPLQFKDVVRACLLDLISMIPRDYVVPSGFVTLFGFNLGGLTVTEKRELKEIKKEADNIFHRLMQLKGEIWRRKLETEWHSVIQDKGIHVIIKWILWCGTIYSLLHHFGSLKVPKEERVLEWSHVHSSLMHLCEEHGIKVPSKKMKLLNKKLIEVWERHAERFEKVAGAFGHIWHEEGKTPLVMVGAAPIRKTRLGKEVFRLKYTLEKDLVETLLPKTDENNKTRYKLQVQKLGTSIREVTELAEEASRASTFNALVSAFPKDQLELEVCNWLKSEIL